MNGSASPARMILFAATLVWFVIVLPISVIAAPYAALVMDARNGKVLHAENADTRLHPASLTKMMTLYVAFQAIENGEISLDTMVRVSRKAASEEPSRLGLRSGQRIKLRYLIRAAAVKSANDASTAIGEAISGSEAAFARRMNKTAKSLGMTRTTFKNAHGLTEAGHLSTARDMTILRRHVFYDFPDYYNLFSRRTTDAGVKTVRHTNTRFLNSYKGADGIKTGYTRAAGFNLVASAERGQERIITTVFGGRSTATRNAQVAKLMDLGFRKAPSRAAVVKPSRKSIPNATGGAQGKVVRMSGLVDKSLRPKARPTQTQQVSETLLASPDLDIQDEIALALAEAQNVSAPADILETSLVPPERPVKFAHVAAPNTRDAKIQEVVTRISTSGQREWSITVGRFTTNYAAEKMLVKTALAEMNVLGDALRKVRKSSKGFDATFVGLSRESADLACRRLKVRKITCTAIGPDS